jgi:hypothetical protein
MQAADEPLSGIARFYLTYGVSKSHSQPDHRLGRAGHDR